MSHDFRIVIDGVKEHIGGWASDGERIHAENRYSDSAATCYVCHGQLTWTLAKGVFTAKCCGYLYRAGESK